jgi:ferredoxin
MRVIIRPERCNKCGVCVSYCPDAFRFDRTGEVTVRYWEIPVGLELECNKATQLCPKEALEVVSGA